MKKNTVVLTTIVTVTLAALFSASSWAKPDASTKYAVIRLENPRQAQERLVLPYAFPSESMGTTFGVGGFIKGYYQDQLLIAGTVFGSADDAYGFIGGLWDYQMPYLERVYFTVLGSLAHYPRQRAYTEVPRRPSGVPPPQAGTNDSDKDNYIQDEGDDNWYDFKFEYVLPLGSAKQSAVADYHLENGILKSGATGGNIWNPLDSGISVLMVGQTGRYQSYETDTVTYAGNTFPFHFGYLYNNTDFPVNPSKGSSQYIAYHQDFSTGEAGDWSFLEFEASKYFDLGESRHARQRVAALNFWTGSSPSWSERVNRNGEVVIVDNPPFFEGAHLGGFYRMRGYPNNRFNDRSVIYTTAEYRHTLKWNPVAGVSWLRWLKLDWFQLVGFVEGGRVAGDYDLGELFSDWKVDGGIGLRAMTAGAVVRFDMAVSEEGSTAWVMFGHPF
ncbi:MAG: BamA/TamA family outer membrane protein [Desulfofustis sp.]|jgi:hypothetical protein|nr:BamA/TamA family outer membrane protein [Desulfofustis sp.]